jgi:hypothetical protein
LVWLDRGEKSVIKFISNQESGGKIIGMILEPENIERLLKGQPIYFYMAELGIQSKDSILIAYTENKDKFMEEIKRKIDIGEIIDKTKTQKL